MKRIIVKVDASFIRFLVVGGLVNLMGIIAFAFLLRTGVAPEILQLLVAIATISLAHHLNRSWSFESNSNYISSLAKYFALNFFVVMAQLMLMLIFYRSLGIHPLVVQIFSIGLLTLVSFFVNRYVIFYED